MLKILLVIVLRSMVEPESNTVYSAVRFKSILTSELSYEKKVVQNVNSMSICQNAT